MAGLAVAGLSTVAALGYTALGFAPEAALLPATLTAGGLFVGGRWIAKGIKGDLAYHRDKRQKVLEELYASDVGSTSKKRGGEPLVAAGRVRRKLEMPRSDRVVAGNSAVKQRATTKRQLKSGRVGGKLRKLNDEVIYRWQRIYNYGQNTIAYPPNITQVDNASGGGRLQLSHFTEGESPSQVNTLPVYLFDLTCWKTENIDGSVPTTPRACCRLKFDGNNNPIWETVYTQYQTHALVGDSSWQLERSNVEDTNGFPRPQERKALLKWSDMRMCFYGARQHPTRIIIELVQFKDEKYTMDFHSSGLPFAGLDTEDQNDVRGFWLEECKKLVYHPLDVQNYARGKGITSLYREAFQIAPDDTTNADICPPNVVKRIFKRFNRLVNWDWETPPVTTDTGVEADKNELETPAFQVGKQSNIKSYAHPNSRIYLYIRAEDMDPVGASEALSVPAAEAPVLSNTHKGQAYYDPNQPGWVVPAVPTGTYVCGYDYITQTAAINASVEEATISSLLPRYCRLEAVPAQWSTTTTPSFDIMIRQKWALQQ